MKRDLLKRPLGYENYLDFFNFVKNKKIRWVNAISSEQVEEPVIPVQLLESGEFKDSSGNFWCVSCGFGYDSSISWWELVFDDDSERFEWTVGQKYKMRNGGAAVLLNIMTDVYKNLNIENKGDLVFLGINNSVVFSTDLEGFYIGKDSDSDADFDVLKQVFTEKTSKKLFRRKWVDYGTIMGVSFDTNWFESVDILDNYHNQLGAIKWSEEIEEKDHTF